jgi:meiosis-specific APC/C activator protein AMA1
MSSIDVQQTVKKEDLNYSKKWFTSPVKKGQHSRVTATGVSDSKFHRRFGTHMILSNHSTSYGSITDRFLPSPESKSDTKLYNHHNTRPLTTGSTLSLIYDHALSAPSFFSTGRVILPNTNETSPVRSGQEDTLSTTNVPLPGLGVSITPNPESAINFASLPQVHKETVARALGIDSGRIFVFKPLRSPKRQKQWNSDVDNFHTPIHTKSNTNVDDTEKDNNNFPSNIPTVFIPEIPFKVLDAPGLRNDFYSNLVCWANKSDTIAAGLGSVVYCWNEKSGTTPLQSSSTDIVSALSYSSSDYLAVGTKESKVIIYSPGSIIAVATYSLKTNTSICSLKWIPARNYFFVGNDVGDVTLFKLVRKDDAKNVKGKTSNRIGGIMYSLKVRSTFKCDQQQICGMDVNLAGNQLAIGANNNCGSIWDISDLSKPKKQFQLKHDAAVKAVAFCPWVPNLLATGGGSRDKHIRFWHSKSGTLISKFKTKGQITAVVWSRSKREILVTFGFGDPNEKNDILAVYTYPSMKLKVKVSAPADMRILTADISNDFSSICTSISDQSVRIYSVWDSKYDLKGDGCEVGVYGSEIIDTSEGVNKTIDTIR